jgi:hypothetical protein
LSDIASRIDHLRARIAEAAERSGRRADDVRLIAVTKGVDPHTVGEALATGITDFGESRIQEAETKVVAFPHLRWHMVGHLQRNKVRQAVRIFSVIESVDSERLAVELSARADGERAIDILLQVNVAGESQKFGVALREVPAILREVAGMPGLRVIGLMTIAPQVADPETVRPVFRSLRELRDSVRASGIVGDEFIHLSMGMTDDFEVAIEEGATMVRIGRAIFGL